VHHAVYEGVDNLWAERGGRYEKRKGDREQDGIGEERREEGKSEEDATWLSFIVTDV
jgi:hypothetical protein